MSFTSVPTRAAERSDLIRQLMAMEMPSSRGASIDATPVDSQLNVPAPWTHISEPSAPLPVAQATSVRDRSISHSRDGAAARAVFMSPPHASNPPPLPPFNGYADPYSGRYIDPQSHYSQRRKELQQPHAGRASAVAAAYGDLSDGGDGHIAAGEAARSSRAPHAHASNSRLYDTAPDVAVDRTAVALAQILRDAEHRTTTEMPPPMTATAPEPQTSRRVVVASQYQQQQTDTLLVSLATILGQQLQQQQQRQDVHASHLSPNHQSPMRAAAPMEVSQANVAGPQRANPGSASQLSVRRPAPAAPSPQGLSAGAPRRTAIAGSPSLGTAWTDVCDSLSGTEASQRLRFMAEEEVVRLRYAAAFEESLAAALMLVHARALAAQQQRARARHVAVADSEVRLRRHAAGARDVAERLAASGSRSASFIGQEAADVSAYDATAIFSSATPNRNTVEYTPMSQLRTPGGGETQLRYVSSHQRTPLEVLAYDNSHSKKLLSTANSTQVFHQRPHPEGALDFRPVSNASVTGAAVASGDRGVLSKDLYYLPPAPPAARLHHVEAPAPARATSTGVSRHATGLRSTEPQAGMPAGAPDTAPETHQNTALPSPLAESAPSVQASNTSVDIAALPAPVAPPPFSGAPRPGHVLSRSCTPHELQSTTAGVNAGRVARPAPVTGGAAYDAAGRTQRPPVHRQPSPKRAPSVDTPSHRRPPPVLRQPSPVRRAPPPPAGGQASLLTAMCWNGTTSESPNPATPLQPSLEVEAAPVVHGARPRVPTLPIMPAIAPPLPQHFPPPVPPETRPPPLPEMNRPRTPPKPRVLSEEARRSLSPAARVAAAGHPEVVSGVSVARPPPPTRRSASPSHNTSAVSAGTMTAATTIRSATPTIARPPAPPFPPRASQQQHRRSPEPLTSTSPAVGAHFPAVDPANRSPMRPAPRPGVVAAFRLDSLGSPPASIAATQIPPPPLAARQRLPVALSEAERHDRIRIVDQREVELVQLYELCETARLRIEERAQAVFSAGSAMGSSSLYDHSTTVVTPPALAYPPVAYPPVGQRVVSNIYPQVGTVPLMMPLADATPDRMSHPAALGTWRAQRLAAGTAIQLGPGPQQQQQEFQQQHVMLQPSFVPRSSPGTTLMSPDEASRPLQLSYSRNRH